MGETKVVRPAVSEQERHDTLVERVGQLLNRKAWGVDVEHADNGAVWVSRKFYGDGIGYGAFISEGVRADLENVQVPGREGEVLFTVGEDSWERVKIADRTVRTWSVLVSATEFTPTPMTDVEESELREQVTMWLPETAPVVNIFRGNLTACVSVKRWMHKQTGRLIVDDIAKAARRMGFAVAASAVLEKESGEGESGLWDARVVITRTA